MCVNLSAKYSCLSKYIKALNDFVFVYNEV